MKDVVGRVQESDLEKALSLVKASYAAMRPQPRLGIGGDHSRSHSAGCSGPSCSIRACSLPPIAASNARSRL